MFRGGGDGLLFSLEAENRIRVLKINGCFNLLNLISKLCQSWPVKHCSCKLFGAKNTQILE